MPVYKGKNGNTYTIIEPALGKGGEGSVYLIREKPDYVLKVFIEKNRTETRHRKLLAMLSTPLSEAALEQITWPVDIAYENGKFVGYVMPAMKNNEDINVLYSTDKYVCTLVEKIVIAKNLCAAINSVHEAGQVCGDLNPKNIVVDPSSARITLVDTDSYHITDKQTGYIYRCEVGLPEYLPREVQEKMKSGDTLRTAPLPTFSRYTDLFALAVHIFALLMNGCHPFACAIDNTVNIERLSSSQPSVAAPQPIDNICNGFFPFYEKRKGITTPKYAPSFDILPDYIQKLFIKAFIDGHKDPSARPDCVEWFNALTTLQGHLKKCKNNPKHVYPDSAKKCPWCKIEENMANMGSSFIPVATTGNKKTPSNPSANTNKKTKTAKISVNRGSIYNTITYSVGIILTIISVGAIVAETYLQASNSDIHGYWIIFVIAAVISVILTMMATSSFGPEKYLQSLLLNIPGGLLAALATAAYFASWWQDLVDEFREEFLAALFSCILIVLVFGVLNLIVAVVGALITQLLPAFLQDITNELIGGILGLLISIGAFYLSYRLIGEESFSLVIPYL